MNIGLIEVSKNGSKVSMSLNVDFLEDGTIVINATDHDKKKGNEISFVELPTAYDHNSVMQMLTGFARKLANKEGIPVRFEDV